jgi:hypothetical protein
MIKKIRNEHSAIIDAEKNKYRRSSRNTANVLSEMKFMG